MEIRVRKLWKRNEMYLAGVTTLNTHSIHNLAMGDSKISTLCIAQNPKTATSTRGQSL